MKKMKVFAQLGTLILAMVFFTSSFAQGIGLKGKIKTSAESRAEQRTVKMTEQLDLSTKQAKSVKSINLKYANKLDKARAAQYKSKEEKKAAIKPILKERDAELKKVLKPTQYKQLKVQQQQKKERMKNRKAQGKHTHGKGHNHKHVNPAERAKKRTEKMKTALNLSTKQTALVEKINLKYAKLKASVKGNDNLALEDRKQKMVDLRVQYDAELERVLTKEQYVKYTQLKAERKKGKGKGKPNGNRPQPLKKGIAK